MDHATVEALCTNGIGWQHKYVYAYVTDKNKPIYKGTASPHTTYTQPYVCMYLSAIVLGLGICTWVVLWRVYITYCSPTHIAVVHVSL